MIEVIIFNFSRIINWLQKYMSEEEINSYKAEKAEQAKIKVHKDFGFLLSIRP